MKIAIQGHPTRGKEVIQILESLSGINRMNHGGNFINYFYYISSDNNTIAWTCFRSGCFNIYTLEESEKIFPFKIGDRVISLITGLIGTITKLSENGIYHFKYDNGIYSVTSASYLKFYKEMKEERNITLTLDKAKEWYNKGGELKEVALQAFTEKELNVPPRSWEEFCKKYSKTEKEAYIGVMSDIYSFAGANRNRDDYSDKNICPSKESAEAHLAMMQLEQLRNCWWNGWEPKWNSCEKYIIKWEGNNLVVFTACRIHAFLAFPTEEIAKEFLECFRDLIEKAGDLI